MNPINTPTFKFKSELVFNDIVTFCENAVLLKDLAPKEIAILFYHIEPSDIKIIYEMRIKNPRNILQKKGRKKIQEMLNEKKY